MSKRPLHPSCAEPRSHDEAVNRAVARATYAAERHGAQAIVSLGHLAHLTGAGYPYLRRIVKRVVDPYTSIERPKRGGGTRSLSAPEPMLMDVQRVILRRAFSKQQRHPASFAYARGVSIADCASVHIGARWLIKVDLRNFFGSIDERQVYEVFTALGYGHLLAFELSRLCTRASRLDPWVHGLEGRGPYRALPRGVLPQGAATSGAIANEVARDMDHRLTEYAIERALAYSRYSDDITMSGKGSFSRKRALRIVREIAEIVELAGFYLQSRKTRIIPPGARKIVVGVGVGPTGIHLRGEHKRHISFHLAMLKKYGAAAHAQAAGFDSALGFYNHLAGYLLFAHGIDPAWTASRAKEFEELTGIRPAEVRNFVRVDQV